jgi:hypothetical protein
MIIITLGIIMLLGAAVAGYYGWAHYSRDRVAVGTYRLRMSEGINIKEVMATERSMLASDEVLTGVIEDLDLTKHWKFDSEQDTLTHMREKLLLRPGKEANMLPVIYGDRNSDMALEILTAIHGRYVNIKRRQHLIY